MMVGLVIQEIGILLFIFGNQYWIFFIARSLQGIASSVTWISGEALLADYFSLEEQGSAVGLALSGVGIGKLVGPLLGFVFFLKKKYKTNSFFFFFIGGTLFELTK